MGSKLFQQRPGSEIVMAASSVVAASLLVSPLLAYTHNSRLPAARAAVSVSRSAVRCADSAAYWKPQALDLSRLTVGQVVPCTVMRNASSGGYEVDIGGPYPALLPRNEVLLKPNQTVGKRGLGQGWGPLVPGLVFEAAVTALGADGSVNVSLARVQRDVAWRRIAQLAELDLTLWAKVLRMGPAGATVDIEGLAAFIPWSHWPLLESERGPQWYGKELPVKFLEMDRSRKRLVVSHRRHKLEVNCCHSAPDP